MLIMRKLVYAMNHDSFAVNFDIVRHFRANPRECQAIFGPTVMTRYCISGKDLLHC